MIGPQGFIAIPQCLKRVQGLAAGVAQVKVGPGVLGTVTVAVVGTSGTFHDALIGDTLSAATEIFPATGSGGNPSTVAVNFPFRRGLLWQPPLFPTGQIVNASYA